MKTVFIINNKSNRLAKALPGIEQYCRKNLHGTVVFSYTEGKRHAIELSREATDNGCNYLIAVGGDGTLHEVINGVLTSQKDNADYPTIGLLPHGSANDFARTAGLSNSVEELIERIQSNTIKRIDLGKIVLDRTGETRYFINIAGLGIGPEVVQKLEESTPLFGPGFHYFSNIIKGFLSYKKKEISCTADDWEWEGKLLQMAVANGCYFGNAICPAPDAKLDDGQFQLVIFGDLSIWDYIKNLGNLKKGLKIDHPQVHYYNSNSISIESSHNCGIEADGEFVGLAPASISVLPGVIDFLMS